MAEAHNAALVRRAVEDIWNRGKLDLADVLFAADYINHAGLIPDLVRGPEAIKISVAFYHTAFPDLQITIDELTAKRDAVLLRWTARSRTPLAGCIFNATQDVLMGIMICRFAHGQIAESWMHWDQAGVLEQLGLLDGKQPPGSVPTPSG
jgi:hypothetical protein